MNGPEKLLLLLGPLQEKNHEVNSPQGFGCNLEEAVEKICLSGRSLRGFYGYVEASKAFLKLLG